MSIGAASGVLVTLRNSMLFKALASYASAAWVLLEVVNTFIDGLGLPDWVFGGVLLLLVVGVPVMILAARNSQKQSNPDVETERKEGVAAQLTLKRAWLGGGVALAAFAGVVGLFMASWALGVGPAASQLAAGSLKSSDPILIADFENNTADASLASTVTEVVRLDLAQSNVVRVLDREQVGDALDRMNQSAEGELNPRVARELAVREGMPAVLEGQVSSLGPATIISAKLVNPRSGKVMVEYSERAETPEKLLTAVDRLSGTLRNKIGEPLTSIRAEPPLEKVTTPSLEALRAYTRANAAHAAGEEAKAVQLLRAALGYDRNFPMAWRKLGALIGDSDPVAAKEAYANAFSQRDKLPQRERHLAAGSYYKNVEGNLPRAMNAYQQVLVAQPTDEVALTNLANLLAAYQRPHEAIQLYERVIEVRPRFAAYSNLFNSLVRTGQLERAKAVYEQAARLYPKQKRVKFQPILLALAHGDFKGADRLFEQYLNSVRGNEELSNDLFVARYEWRRGRLDAARNIFRERAAIASQKGDLADALEASTSLVAIAQAMGDLETGRTVLRQSLQAYPLSQIPEGKRPHIDLAIAYALVQLPSEARSHLELAAKQGPPDGSLLYDHTQRALGLIALAEGRPLEAVRILTAASRFGQCGTCLLLDLGLAAEAAGRDDVAKGAYERYSKLAPSALGRAENYGFVLARLSALQRKAGDLASSRATLARLQKLWISADALASDWAAAAAAREAPEARPS